MIYVIFRFAVARLKNHPGASIYTLNKTSRDAMKEQIYSNMVELLQNGKVP